MTPTSSNDKFPDHLQRILNAKKKDDLCQQYDMQFEEHCPQISPAVETEWLDYITEFERQFENAKPISVREQIGNPTIKPLVNIPDSELTTELNNLLELLYQNNIVVDFLHQPEDRERYRFITEELFNEITDDIRIPGLFCHFIYEEFYPDDEDDMA
jgi:hypothetical protein